MEDYQERRMKNKNYLLNSYRLVIQESFATGGPSNENNNLYVFVHLMFYLANKT